METKQTDRVDLVEKKTDERDRSNAKETIACERQRRKYVHHQKRVHLYPRTRTTCIHMRIYIYMCTHENE